MTKAMKKLILLSLVAVSLVACFQPATEEVTFTWNIRNQTGQDIIIKLMEKPSGQLGNSHSLVTRQGELRTYQIEVEMATPNPDFDMYWTVANNYGLKNKVQCEVWAADNRRMLKRWTQSELENDSVGMTKKHFFRASDWKRVYTLNADDYTWYFELTGQDLQ